MLNLAGGRRSTLSLTSANEFRLVKLTDAKRSLRPGVGRRFLSNTRVPITATLIGYRVEVVKRGSRGLEMESLNLRRRASV